MNDETTGGEGHRVAMDRGRSIMTLSHQWWDRPDDERFLSLDDLYRFTKGAAEMSREDVVDLKNLRAGQAPDNGLFLSGPDQALIGPTHWSFGQLCSEMGAPASYLRSLPAGLAAENLNHGFGSLDVSAKLYTAENGKRLLRAVTGPNYGRIYDHDVVRSVMQVTEDGTGDQRWKVPGVLDWATRRHNPNVDVTKATTTLFASDRDMFVFLCDDRNPIEIGKLDDGEPDLVFRGFYVWNSEVGKSKVGIATMYLRTVCANRILWGVEEFDEISFAHYKRAPERLVRELLPALNSYAEASTQKLVDGVFEAKKAVVATTPEERIAWLIGNGFSGRRAAEIVAVGTREENRPPYSVWDFSQAITATARDITHQDKRIALERQAKVILDKVVS